MIVCVEVWCGVVIEGLWRMERLMHDDQLRQVEVIPVRLDDVSNCYSTLREMDGRDDASYSPRANKYIVLDLSSDAALRRILKQVRARER